MSPAASSSYLEDPLLLLYTLHPLCVSEELPPPPPPSTPSIRTPFCRAGFYLYLAGDWQLTFCTRGNFWERGQDQWVSCLSPSFWDPLYTFMYLSSYLFIRTTIQRHTPPLLSAFSSSLVLFSGMNIWPGFNFLSFPATGNWKTPLKGLFIAKK